MPDKDWVEFVGSEWIEKEVKVIHPVCNSLNKNYRKLFHNGSYLIFHSGQVQRNNVQKIWWQNLLNSLGEN